MSWMIYYCPVRRYITLPEVYDASILTIIIIIIIYNYHYLNVISWFFRSVNFHNIFKIILWFFSLEYTLVRSVGRFFYIFVVSLSSRSYNIKSLFLNFCCLWLIIAIIWKCMTFQFSLLVVCISLFIYGCLECMTSEFIFSSYIISVVRKVYFSNF